MSLVSNDYFVFTNSIYFQTSASIQPRTSPPKFSKSETVRQLSSTKHRPGKKKVAKAVTKTIAKAAAKSAKKKNRPSPSESATSVKEGTKKRGNDGNMWITKKNSAGVPRWVKL